MSVDLEACVGEVAEGVHERDVAGRFGLEHIIEGFLAMLHDGVEKLNGDDRHGGTMDDAGLDVPKFPDQVSGEFGGAPGAFDGLAILEMLLMAGLDPLRKALGSQA